MISMLRLCDLNLFELRPNVSVASFELMLIVHGCSWIALESSASLCGSAEAMHNDKTRQGFCMYGFILPFNRKVMAGASSADRLVGTKSPNLGSWGKHFSRMILKSFHLNSIGFY